MRLHALISLSRRALIAASLLLTALPSGAATATLTPTADAYVRNGLLYAGRNYGTAATLIAATTGTASNNYDSYLKFNTSSVSGIASARLRLYAALSAAGSVSGSIYAVADTSWTETGITWSTKPALGAALGTVTVNGTAYGWYELDVTAYVQGEYNANRKVVSLALHNTATSSATIQAQSREAANKPQLVITYNAGPPAVSLTSPAEGSAYTTPATIPLSATASDADGIAQVEFLADNAVVATVTTAPYAATWSNPPQGSHQIVARATDTLGLASTSAPAGITVNAPSLSLYYLETDQLGTPRMASDAANHTVWRWDRTDPFGDNAANDDADGDGHHTPVNLRFPGQYFDAETGLHYNTFRDYDPTTGRYVEADPVGLEGGLNVYTYVGGNPISRIDPLGLFFQFSNSQQSLTWVDPNTGGTSPSTTWPARSGPWGKGSLPEGWYELTPEENPVKSEKRSMQDTCGNDYKFRLHPQFPTDRDGLLIHPDGGTPGTMGCIGALGCTSSLRNFINSGIHGGGGLNVKVVP
jgi:RHS repeat-associated protein